MYVLIEVKATLPDRRDLFLSKCAPRQGVPKPRGHGPVPRPVRNWAAQQELSGGMGSYGSFIWVYSCPPSLALPPELRLLPDQR